MGTARSFTIGTQDFLLDGQPHRVLSGALHYFRVHPDQWRERIRAGREMGLNTIETYVAWNEHAPTPDVFDTTGRLDLARFLRDVQAEGMHAIVRPGPYICAEFDGGGLPAWLFRDPTVGVRSLEPRYFSAVSDYLARVFEIVAPLQIDRGGPVVLLQVENEYGAYGADHDYLHALTNLFRAGGITVPLLTVDQPEPEMLRAGNIPELHATGSFGSRATERLASLRAQQPTGPLMCSEFWCGWFDHWGAEHHTTDAAAAAAELDAVLAAGASVNIYMLHGGTNYGFTNGANDKGVYQPTVTSYDYDAPLDEAGRPTAKYWAFRDVIAKYAPVPDIALPRAAPFSQPEPVPLERLGSVDDLLAEPAWQRFSAVPTMDDLNISRGFCRYLIDLNEADAPVVFAVTEVRDRAWIRLDGAPVGVLARESHENSITLPRGRGRLEILVEDEGRVNYGPRIGEPKGLIGPALLGGRPLTGWQAAGLSLEELPDLARWAPTHTHPVPGAEVLRAVVTLRDPTDLIIDTTGFGKGMMWANGFPLGRYWRKGPQRSLYIPAPATRSGENLITVMELESATFSHLRFAPDLILGPTEN